MKLKGIKNRVLRFLKNIYYLTKYDIKEIRDKVFILNSYITKSAKIEKILEYYETENTELKERFNMELEFIRNHKCPHYFPYKYVKRFKTNVITGYDNEKKMVYVMHNEKRLYFSKEYTESTAKEKYIDYIEGEEIISFPKDEKYHQKMPHQYESAQICVRDGDILLDIGAMEGLFALHYIDKVSKILIVEPDPLWIMALRATFKAYKDKVKIIAKFLTEVDSKKTITLETLLKGEIDKPLFTKMDIEGFEIKVISSSVSYLKTLPDETRIVCATYHKQDDADILENLFKEAGYTSSFSDGYMLFDAYDKSSPPYFRRGLIRAKK